MELTSLKNDTEQPGFNPLLSLALISAATLNFEVLLTRHIAIEHWHHLTAVVIAIALLGFGVAGSMATVFAHIIRNRYHQLLSLCALGVMLSFPASQLLADLIPLNMLALPWYPQQYAYLVLYALCWLPAFLLTGLYISISFMHWPKSIAKLYGADLIGAAIGAATAMIMLELNHFTFGMVFSTVLAGIALLLQLKKRVEKVFLIIAMAALLLLNQQQLLPTTKSNSFKEASIRQNETDAKLLWQQDTVHGRLSLLATPTQHASPGLSINSNQTAPAQWQLFIDGDQASPMLLHAGQHANKNVFSQSLYAAPYQLLTSSANVLLLGGNPSWNSWLAYWHQAKSITLLDPHKQLTSLLTAINETSITNLNDKKTTKQPVNIIPNNVELESVHPRRYIGTTKQHFELILASVGSSPVGSAASRSNYIMTRQGLSAMFERLSNDGILAINNIMAPLPRDNLRVLNSVISLLKKYQLVPEHHLTVIRDWRTLVILVSKQPINSQQRDSLYNWSRKWHFDLAALPGLTRDEANRYHIKPEPMYFDGIAALVGKNNKEYVEGYLFNLSPTDDNKPYLYHGFRWQKLAQLQQALKQRWPLLVGWGYLLGLASLLLLTPLALIFILLPLWFSRRPQQSTTQLIVPMIYFSCLGIGFMAIEITLLQQSFLLLDSATSALATVLSAVLIGSGLGSITLGANKLSGSKLLLVILVYTGILFLAFSLFPYLVHATLTWSLLSRLFLVFVIITALVLPLGMFLPYGLNRLTAQQPVLLAWCWGINGFASVFGVLLAPVVAMEFGLNALLGLGLCCYLLAGLVNLLPPVKLSQETEQAR